MACSVAVQATNSDLGKSVSCVHNDTADDIHIRFGFDCVQPHDEDKSAADIRCDRDRNHKGQSLNHASHPKPSSATEQQPRAFRSHCE